jgi:hypothetical protein
VGVDMSSRFKHIAIFLGLLFTVTFCEAQNDLADAFNALVSSTQPGVYETQERGFLTAGSYQVRFPTHSVQLISLSQPHVEGGCSGISFFTGGLSYVNADEFVKLLKGIAANAIGYSFQLALKTLCPVCSTILSDIQRAVQAANRLAINQCQFAMGLVNKAIQSNSALNDFVFGKGANAKAQEGDNDGFMGAVNSFSGDVEKAFDAIADELERIEGAAAKQQHYNALPLGNVTWKSLTGMSDIQRIFIQSLLGTRIVGKVGAKENAQTLIEPIAPSIKIHELSTLFMYGAKAVVNQGLNLTECANSDVIETEAPHDKCSPLTRRTIKASQWYAKNKHLTVGGVPIADVGFYGLAYALMFQALWDVENNQPLGTAASIHLPAGIYQQQIALKPAFTAAQIEAFISLAPLPLYRAINIGAIFPSISEALVNNVAGVVSAHYAVAYIKHEILTLKTVGQVSSDKKDKGLHQLAGLPGDTFIQLERAIESLQTHVDQQMQLVLTQLQSTATWSAQINQVQSLIYAQVLQNGLSENVAYSLGLRGGD